MQCLELNHKVEGRVHIHNQVNLIEAKTRQFVQVLGLIKFKLVR